MASGRPRVALALLGLAIVAPAALAPAVAHAQTTVPARLVTFVARVCPSYSDIAANRARNNIQEDLVDLGPDTVYTAGQPVNPATEQTQQPNCTPLPGWQFTMGKGYVSRAVTGPWGSLSVVTSPFSTSVVTQDSVPLLNSNGDPTGAQIEGAVTVPLTSAESTTATQGSGLWAQGGTPTDPVLNQLYPGAYGFGSLRCAIDDLNGDNVETIGFPQGARHVFCYAYYVAPPPTSGTIIVRKQVTGSIAAAPQAFTFSGNISFTSNHNFTLTAGSSKSDSATFYRAETGAGDAPWSFQEQTLPGWTLAGLTCSSASGGSSTTTDLATGTASVTLAAGDTVTCTYTDSVTPPPAGLTISKRTLGGTGSFDFSVTNAAGTSQHQTITTTQDGVSTAGNPLSLPPGDYKLGEIRPPSTPNGHWTLDSVSCDGQDLGSDGPFSVSLTSGTGAACEFTNTFVPSGSIVLRQETLGALGTVGFLVRPTGISSSASYSQTGTTTSEGTPVRATGNDLSNLPLGTYDIVETNPTPLPGGYWTLDAVLCNGLPVGSAQGRMEITLTASSPNIDCLVINRFVRGTEPPNPTNPAAPPPSAPPDSVQALNRAKGPFANLSITKRVSLRVAHPGQRLVYTIVVVNHGPNIAYDVVGVEVSSQGREPITLHPRNRGVVCRAKFPARCSLGMLLPHHRVILTVDTTPGFAGRFTDVVAVSSSTADPNLKNNRASATVRVVPAAPPPRVTG
ncbi:MAG TPA: DUF11 domain-containing protein [Solirubrobacteraceae bacterium]|nr:DUF11 domain-containing protein [Solirubrobacteraceae bacterium]